MITINGKTYCGNNVSILNNVVYIDGKRADTDSDEKVINITVDGNIQSIKADVCHMIYVKDAGSVQTVSGDVSVSGKVSGSVTTVSGDVRSNSIGGSVTTISGDVTH